MVCGRIISLGYEKELEHWLNKDLGDKKVSNFCRMMHCPANFPKYGLENKTMLSIAKELRARSVSVHPLNGTRAEKSRRCLLMLKTRKVFTI